ncbi:MAG: helix-turn-helix domain-containing protein, partial [Bacteroidia bacterium]
EYIFLAVVLYVVFIGYYGIKQVGIFTNQLPAAVSLATETAAANMPLETLKYERSLLNDHQLEAIHQELQRLMIEKKLYLTPELTLTMVSQELDLHPNTLSQVINTLEQKNFFDYINTLRVQEFKAKVVQPENHKYTLLSLAYECGFNSKTSFNRNFKNSTGKSPTEYLREIHITLK